MTEAVARIDSESVLLGYSSSELAALSEAQLQELIIKDEDRVPMSVIEECARRGAAMEAMFGELVDEKTNWFANDDEPGSGYWWLHLHAIMILGRMHSEASGELLLKFMWRMDREDDDSLQDWLAGYWPALVANKPRKVLLSLREMAQDLQLSEWMRYQAVGGYIGWFDQHDDPELEDALHWAATCADREDEVPDFRLLIGSMLLDYPRAELRPVLEKLAATQTGPFRHFDSGDIERAYNREKLPPWREQFKDPWHFYEPQQIEQRQQRWREEDERRRQWQLKKDAELLDDHDDYMNGPAVQEPYVRDLPKLGRNDPCHCGSGRKYKKCCLAEDERLSK